MLTVIVLVLFMFVVPDELFPIKVPFEIVSELIVKVPSEVPEKPVRVPPFIVTAAILFVRVPDDVMHKLLAELAPKVREEFTLNVLLLIFTTAV